MIRVCVIDMATSAVLCRITEPYDGPWERLKESDAQKQAQQQQNDFNKQLLQIYKTQFSESQAILSVLTPQLEGMAAHPQGFGVTEYAALQSGIIAGVASAFSNVAKQNALEFATSNEAGLPSGVKVAVDAANAATAAGEVATQSTNLAVANEQLKNQQQEFALGNLGSEAGTVGSETATTGSQAGSGLQSQFQNATTVFNQGSMWKNILGGVIGAGTNFLTGGFSGLLQGGGFLAGAGQALGGAPVSG